MLHFGEVLKEEIYARGGIVVGGVKRAEGSFETMGFKWRFFLPFFSLLKRKGNISVVNPSVSLAADSSLYTREPLVRCNTGDAIGKRRADDTPAK